MTRIKRPAAAVGAAVLLAFSLTACGGGAPDDASEDDFCEVVLDEPGEDADSINKWGDELEEVGTPEDIPEDAREGFEILVDLAKDVDDDDLENENFIDEFSGEDQEKFAAYSAYLAETCIGDLPTDVPSDLTDIPTELSDLPTDLSDLPTTTE
jgi:hypothetical protein